MLPGITPRLCELGKLKIGKKEDKIRESKGGGTWRAPQKLDHFLVTTLERDSAGDLKVDERLMARLIEKYGDADKKLRQIPVTLLSDDIDEVVPAVYAYYDSRKIVARCDGKAVTWFKNKEGVRIPEGRSAPCNGEHAKMSDGNGKPLFKVHATLNCIIADGEAHWGGVYKFRTTSKNSLAELYGSMGQIKLLTSGLLQGLPLRLVVRPREVQTPDEKTSKVYIVNLELHGQDLGAIQKQALESAQLRLQNARAMQDFQREYKALAARAETEEEQADIAEEFHPGPENARPPEPKDVTPAPPASEPAAEAAPAKVARKPKAAPPPPADAPSAEQLADLDF